MSEEITALIKYRMEQAQTSLDDAKFLLDSNLDSNRSPQSIVNRAYYAMFYATLALLQKIGKVPSKHSGVISLFDTEFVLKGMDRDISKDYGKKEMRRGLQNQVPPKVGQIHLLTFCLSRISVYKIKNPVGHAESVDRKIQLTPLKTYNSV